MFKEEMVLTFWHPARTSMYKNMKKFLFFFLAAALSLATVTSCNVSDAFIQATVKAGNASCPLDMGNGMTMTKIDYSGSYVTYIYECDENLYSPSQDKATPELKQELISSLRTSASTDPSVKQFLDALKKNGTGIIYHYYAPGSPSTMDVIIESPEL